MDPARRHVLWVAARALLLLPVFLTAWYFAAGAFSYAAGKAALPIIRVVSGGGATMELKDRVPLYTVKLEMPYRRGGVPRVAVDVEVAALKFTYGIALFLALAFAARESRQVLGIVVGCIILVLLPAVGIASDALKQLGSSPQLSEFLRWSGGTREMIALGYQVGTLLLPTLIPVAIWLFLTRAAWMPPFTEPGAVRKLPDDSPPREQERQ